MKAIRIIVFAFFCLFLASCSKKPEVIYINGKIYTLDKNNTVVEAIAVNEGKVLALGKSGELQEKYKNAKVVDLKGKTVVPGFIDAEANLMEFSKQLSLIDLRNARSVDEIISILKERVKSSKPGDAGITLNGNSVNVSPGAYGSLNDGQTEVITLGFNVVDGHGGSVAQTASITITGITDPFVASTVSGTVFIDLVDNIYDILPPTSAAPIRDGIKSDDEEGLSGIPVRLVATGTNNAPTTTVYTDMDGAYRFTNVAPGTYNVVYDLPDSVIFVGASTTPISIGAAGGESASGGNVGSLGLSGGLSKPGHSGLQLHAFESEHVHPSANGGLEGGTVALDSSGNQTLFKAGEGFDDVDFAELTLNADQDAALLTIIEDGVVKTAQLSEDHFCRQS